MEPVPQYKKGYLTDLIRLESIKAPYLGQSQDIPLDRKTTLSVIEGSYNLARYTSYQSHQYERISYFKKVYIPPHKTIAIKIPYYVSERSFRSFKSKEDKG